MEPLTPVVLAIGTTHPLNVAGLGLGARVAESLGVRAVTVVAGISAQSASEVLARSPVGAELIAAQFAALRDVPVHAVHVGAVVDARSVRVIAEALSARREMPVVCDPVISATTGGRLADDGTVAALRDELFSRCRLITPNLDEAAQLLCRSISDVREMEAAACDLLKTGVRAVLLKGGHLAGDAVDVLLDGTEIVRFSAPRIQSGLRGTGDLLAFAIAARLAHGDSLVRSVETARAYVRKCLAASVDFAGTRTIS